MRTDSATPVQFPGFRKYLHNFMTDYGVTDFKLHEIDSTFDIGHCTF